MFWDFATNRKIDSLQKQIEYLQNTMLLHRHKLDCIDALVKMKQRCAEPPPPADELLPSMTELREEVVSILATENFKLEQENSDLAAENKKLKEENNIIRYENARFGAENQKLKDTVRYLDRLLDKLLTGGVLDKDCR